MGSFKERFERRMANDPELREEYERLAPRFAAISALIGARQRAGVSQSELARRMGVSPGVISRLESGEHSPRLDTIAEAAAALGCELRVQFKRQPKKKARGDEAAG